METPFGAVPDRFLPEMSMAEQHAYLRSRLPRRRFLRGAALGAGLLVAGPTLWRRPGFAAEAPGGRHLTFGTDPRTEMTVSWSTSGPVQHAVVDVGTDIAYGTTVEAETRTVAGTATNYHHARVTGLRPGTTYHYRSRHDGGAAEDASFRTAPASGTPFRFTAFGDQGVSDGARSVTAQVATLGPAFHLHAGDICYANNRGLGKPAELNQPTAAVWDTWLAMMTAVATSAPWMAAVGNHEMEGGYGEQGYDGYLSRFALPGGGPSGAPVVHGFRYGNVAVLSLDANDASYEITANTGYTGTAQDTWLRRTLSGLRTDPTVDFVVAQFHHCSYCTNAVHGSDGGVRDRWAALFDEFSVDLVVNGHNHCYERTHPLRAGEVTAEVGNGGTVKPAEQGTTYITAGGGGQQPYSLSTHPIAYVTIDGGLRVPEPASWSASRYLDLSLIAVDVVPPGVDGRTTMTVRALTPDGAVVDAVTLERTRSVVPARGPGGGPDATASADVRGGRLAATGGLGATAGLVAAGAAAALRAAQRKTDER